MSIAITQGPAGAPVLDPALRMGSAVFAVTPHGATFKAPVSVRIPLNASVDAGALLAVLHAEEGGPWEELTSYARDDDAVEVEVTGFSYFVVVMRTVTAATTPLTITIAPLAPGYVQSASGSWTYSGDPAPTPVLVPVQVSVTGTPSCPSGETPGIVGLVTGGAGTRKLVDISPRAAAWPMDATEIDLPLLHDVSGLEYLATRPGLSKVTIALSAFVTCTGGPPVGSLAQSNTVSRDLLVGSPVGLGVGAGPADQTVAPGVRPSFSIEILGGPQHPTASDEYVVDWQRSDDGGQTWRAAYDEEAYELQMEPDAHLAATGSEQGFLVRRSVFTAPAAREEDDGALFQARACYRIPPAFQQFSPATSSCVFSRAARLTVRGTTVVPGAPTIIQQPRDVAVTVSSPGTFSVAATGDAPLAYQWLRNGVAIPGATGASYTTPAMVITDSGATFSVVVWNHGGAVVSDGAQLTVTAATAGFQVVHVDPADGSEGNLAAAFSTSTATFSANLDCGHLPANSFQVFEGASTVPGTVGCSGNTLSFTPVAGAFPTNTTLHVLLDAGIGDGAGHTLGAAFTWSFGVAPWTRQIGSAAYDEARAVRVDAQRNVFVVGYTNGGLDGNTLTGTSDLFAVKYQPSGARLWTRQLGAAGTYTYGLASAVDGTGNLYVAGECAGALDGNTSNGSSDIILVKYDPAGTKLWTHQYGTAADDHVGGVAIDAAGNVYVSGWSQGSFGGVQTAGAEDIVLLKLDADGNVQWVRETGSTKTDEPTSVAVDGEGNVLVAGYTTGVLDGPGNAGTFDLFVAKFDPAGTYLWARQLGTPGIDVATAVAADASGNVYVTGYTYGSLDGHPNQGSIDGFVLKYDASGAKQWSVQLGTPGDDFGLGITVDASGSPY
ncbi:MAG: SBBP repeat-containing protein, partial [Myxococcaceae bacterium]